MFGFSAVRDFLLRLRDWPERLRSIIITIRPITTSHNRTSHDCDLWHHAQFPCETGVCCGSYDGLQRAGNRDYCEVATQGLQAESMRPAAGRGQCVYACHRALKSSDDRRLRGTDRRVRF